MNKLIYALFFFVLIGTFGCKKGDTPDPVDKTEDPDSVANGGLRPRYYFKFKWDGVQKEYKLLSDLAYSALIDIPPADGSGYICNFSGFGDGQSYKKSNVTITMDIGKETLKTGITYTDYTTTKNGEIHVPVMLIDLNDENGLDYTSFREGYYFESRESNSRVKVTELTDKFVKGEFSSVIYTGAKLDEKHIISEGLFYCEIIPQK